MFDELYNDTIMDQGECSEFQGQRGGPARRVDAYNARSGEDESLFVDIDNQSVIRDMERDTDTDVRRAAASMLAESLAGQAIGFVKVQLVASPAKPTIV